MAPAGNELKPRRLGVAGLVETSEVGCLNGQIEYIPITEVKAGDFVLSLNEATGAIEPHRINGLLDMGVKPVFKLTTEDGRTIRTTGNHPYLVKTKNLELRTLNLDRKNQAPSSKLQALSPSQWKKVCDLNVGDEIAVAREENLSSAVSVFPGINAVNNNTAALYVKTNAVFSNSESVGSRGDVDQRFSERKRGAAGDKEFNLFDDSSLELSGELFEFPLSAGSEFDPRNHAVYDSPNSCLIFSKGTSPNFLASSMPFLSRKTNLGLTGRWASIASMSQPTGLWNTYSFGGAVSSNFASKVQSKFHSEYVSSMKYLGEPFLSTNTPALKSFGFRPDFLSSAGVTANLESGSNLTGSRADNFAKDFGFIVLPPFGQHKYNTLILSLSRLLSMPDAEVAVNTPVGARFIAPEARVSTSVGAPSLASLGTSFMASAEKHGAIEFIPIVAVKQGDFVLSLNEATGAIEPHRINGLLDMGVKPVFKLTTEDGRFIKTTGNHPYLTKDDWKKVAELRVGEKIALAKSEAVDSVAAFADNNKASGDLFFRNTPNDIHNNISNFINGQKIYSHQNNSAITADRVAQDVPEVGVSGNKNQGVFLYKFINFVIRGGRIDIADIQNQMASFDKDSSYTTGAVGVNQEFHDLGGKLADKFLFTGQNSGVKHAGVNIIDRDGFVFFLNLTNIHPASQCFKDNINRGAGIFNAGPALLDSGIHADMLFDQIFINHFISSSLMSEVYHRLKYVSSQIFVSAIRDGASVGARLI
ncbi:MAG: hypothetical protein AABZ06_11790, partial [Bdellovibrionota bacterium]